MKRYIRNSEIIQSTANWVPYDNDKIIERFNYANASMSRILVSAVNLIQKAELQGLDVKQYGLRYEYDPEEIAYASALEDLGYPGDRIFRGCIAVVNKSQTKMKLADPGQFLFISCDSENYSAECSNFQGDVVKTWFEDMRGMYGRNPKGIISEQFQTAVDLVSDMLHTRPTESNSKMVEFTSGKNIIHLTVDDTVDDIVAKDPQDFYGQVLYDFRIPSNTASGVYDFSSINSLLTSLSAEPKRSSSNSWQRLLDALDNQMRSGIDPLYEQTSEGEKINSICQDIESQLGYLVEPSIQGGQGGIWIYDDDDVLVEDYDYQTFNQEVLDVAFSSRNKSEFINNYRDYLSGLVE